MMDQEPVMSDEIIASVQLDTVRSEEGVTSAEEKLSVTSQGSIDDPLADELPSLEQSVIGEEQLESKDPGDETKLINTDDNPIEAQVVSGDLGSSEEPTGTSADQPEKIAVSLVEPVVEGSEEVVNPVDGLVSDDAEKTVANATSVEDLSEPNADQPEKVAVSLDEPVVEAFEGALLERFTQLSGVAEFTESELSLILRAALSALSDSLTDIKSVSDNGDGSVDNDGPRRERED